MHLLGTWKVEIKDGDNISEVEITTFPEDNTPPHEFPGNVYEDYCTTDILGSSYGDEIRFIFTPSPDNFDADGNLKPVLEIYAMLKAKGWTTDGEEMLAQAFVETGMEIPEINEK